MTVYNEAKFIPASLPAMLSCPDISSITIVEGAYQEVIATGCPARSTDGTVGLIMGMVDVLQIDCAPGDMLWEDRVALIQANEQSDTQQRNAGLNYIRDNFCNIGDGIEDYLMIVDGDEVWEHSAVKVAAGMLKRRLNITPIDCMHVKSRTFINNLQTYTWHEFPRFFRITPSCKFVNDNYMSWEYAEWNSPTARHIRTPIEYFHYSFMRPPERMEMKTEWWNTRFGDRDFTYDWNVEDGKAVTTGDYAIFEFEGRHPQQITEMFGLTNESS